MGKQRPREWGQKCGTMPNFIPWGLGHVIWDNINARPTYSARAHRILKFGIYWADMGQDTAIQTFLSKFSSF